MMGFSMVNDCTSALEDPPKMNRVNIVKNSPQNDSVGRAVRCVCCGLLNYVHPPTSSQYSHCKRSIHHADVSQGRSQRALTEFLSYLQLGNVSSQAKMPIRGVPAIDQRLL